MSSVISLFFHALLWLQDGASTDTAPRAVQIPPKAAGRWLFTSITVAGESRPLQVAALPAIQALRNENGKAVHPYLAFYCQAETPLRLHSFLDARQVLTEPIEVKVNSRLYASNLRLDELAPKQYKIPAELTSLLSQAQQVEIAGQTFLLLNWPQMQARLAQACRQ